MSTADNKKILAECYKQCLLDIDHGNIGNAVINLKKLHDVSPLWIMPLLALANIAISNPSEINTEEQHIFLEKLNSHTYSKDIRALILLGRYKKTNKDFKGALIYFNKAIDIEPSSNLAAEEISLIYLELGNWGDAERCLTQQLLINPDQTHLLCNLSVAVMRQNRLNEALKISKKALHMAKKDQLAAVYVNLGSIYQELDLLKEAQSCYKKALKRESSNVNALLNLGVVAFQGKKFVLAEQMLRKVLSLDESNQKACINLAGLLLLQKREEEGWILYEKRIHKDCGITTWRQDLKIWKGEMMTNDALLVQHEQGIGDTFQFLRYLYRVKEIGISCYFYGPSKLHGIVYSTGTVEKCLDENDPIPNDVKAWIPLMSLPILFDATIEKPLLSPGQYIVPDKDRTKKWDKYLKKTKKLRVAIHWQGNPDHEFTISRGRSIGLKAFESLLANKNIEWISLQKGPGSEQIDELGLRKYFSNSQALIDKSWEFEEATAIIQNCDVIVSSDSGIAHLAGAIGKPVYLLLPWLAEWRWGLIGNKTEWYPNHILIRQMIKYDWQHVISDLGKILEERAIIKLGAID